MAAVTAPKVSEETPKKSVEKSADETPAAEEVKESKKSKSRSRSRGPLGFFKTKKEEVKEKVEGEDKVEETPAAEPVAAESTPAGKLPSTNPSNVHHLTCDCRDSSSHRLHGRTSHHRCRSSS